MKKIYIIAISLLLFSVITKQTQAQSQLDSNTYTILDATVNSGGEITDSDYYGLISNTGSYISDYRFTSDSYTLQHGFPNGIIANVPKINCLETNTTSGTTSCSNVPTSNGMQGICGTPGCYNKAKLEIDTQNNPTDALYLIKIIDTDTNKTYYMNNSHTLSTTVDINSFLDKCDLEGKDSTITTCDDSGDARWDEDLQKFNILGLKPNTNYSISVSALSGDFTGTQFSTESTITTTDLSIVFDLDAHQSDQDTAAPHNISLGAVPFNTVGTATKKIWIDVSTNALDGAKVYVKDAHNGLYSATTNETIPSESEDLDADPNSNGGFGIKMSTLTETSLGPLYVNTTYDTAQTDEVGALSTINTLLLYTESTNGHHGPINGGRASFLVKFKSVASIKSADMQDILTFTCLNTF